MAGTSTNTNLLSLGVSISTAVHNLPKLSRLTVTGSSGRKLCIVRAADGSLVAIDFHCFHHGGELGDGALLDIEDIGTAVTCPAHGYVVSVQTGERLVQSGNEHGHWQRHGVVQRTHSVTVDAAGGVHVALSDRIAGCGPGTVPSDAYNLAVSPLPQGASIAFACRKSRAVEAIERGSAKRRAVPSAMETTAPSTPSPSSPAVAGPAATTSAMRQTTLTSMFAARSAHVAPSATAIKPSHGDGSAMDIG